MKKVNPIRIKENMKVSELVRDMSGMGFGAGSIGRASEIMKKMFSDDSCKVFLGVAGAMVPAGMRELILDLLDETDVFVTTGANLTHDLVEALGENHYKTERKFDDVKLHEDGFYRMYDVVMNNSVYEKLEDFFENNWDELKGCKTIKEFLWKVGELCPGNGILKKCFEKKIPVFCPALADSGIGLMIWGRKRLAYASPKKGEEIKAIGSIYTSPKKEESGAVGKNIEIDAFEDMSEIIDIAWTSDKRGIIYVGGGVPKNFIQQSLQFSKGANYGIQITTDRQESGGSSGAPLKEGISWGKLNENAEFVDVFCDATIALPLIFGSLK